MITYANNLIKKGPLGFYRVPFKIMPNENEPGCQVSIDTPEVDEFWYYKVSPDRKTYFSFTDAHGREVTAWSNLEGYITRITLGNGEKDLLLVPVDIEGDLEMDPTNGSYLNFSTGDLEKVKKD